MSKSSVDLERLSAAVEQVESGGNPNAVSPKGAEGPMQVMPKTGKRPGYGVMPARDKSPEENRRVGRDYLAAMVNKYGNVDNALVAYNWGPGNTDKWLRKGADPDKLPMETQKYVPRVMGLLGETSALPMQVADRQSPGRAGLDNQKFIEARAAARSTRRASNPAVPSPVAEGPLKGLSLAHVTGVEKIGPSYQAALALSMGAGSGMGAGARPAEQEAMPEEVLEESAQPSRASVALAQLKDMPVSSAFGAGRAMADGGLAGDEDYAPIDFLPPESYESSPAKLLSLRKTPQSASVSELSKMPIPGGMEQKQETVTAKKGKKGSAKSDLAALEYKLALQSASVKDRQQGLGSSTSALGSPTFTRRSDINKPSLNVAHFDKGGTASQMLEVLKGYGKKAQEFAVENMISPADIATLALKAKNMVPAGMLTYAGSLNEGEDEELARMRANDKPPVPRAEGSPPVGEKSLRDRVGSAYRGAEKAVSAPLGITELRNYASNRPKEIGLKGEIGGQADAMRHLLLARELRTKFPTAAGAMLWAHEAIPSNPIMPWQSDKERAQDQYNNDLAKRLMEENPEATREQYEQRALKAVKSGEAQSGLTKEDLRYRAGGSPEEGERSIGDRLMGYGETAASLLSGVGASIPAGYSGLMELARTRDPEMAANEIAARQAALTYAPRTTAGKESTASAAELLENLNVPAQKVGDVAFDVSGNSPVAGAAAQTLLDPLNFIPGAKSLGKLGKKGIQKAIENAAVPGDPFFSGSRGKQRGAVKPYGGTFARNSPEFIAAKENPVMSERPNTDYISNLEKYYAQARTQVDDAAGGFEPATVEQKQAMREFYDDKAIPYFEELHGTLRDPIFESLAEGRIKPYGSSASSSAFRPYLIREAKRKKASSGFRHAKDPEAFEDLTRRYDDATGIRPVLYYPNEKNLIDAATKNSPEKVPALGGGVSTMEGEFLPAKALTKDQAAQSERGRTADFIRNQMETQQAALPNELRNQYLNPVDEYSVQIREPKDLGYTSASGVKGALDDITKKLYPEPTPGLLKRAKNMLAGQPEEKKQGYSVSDKMLEAMTRNEPIYDIGASKAETRGPLNFLSVEHLNDYMRTLPPEQIKETPFATMVEESAKYQAYKEGVNQHIRDIKGGKGVDPKVFSTGVSEPIKTYDNGFRWVKANNEDALKLNGASVGHCLVAGARNCSLSGQKGGTGRKSFDSGDTEIYFLQDARGVPMTTLEVVNAKDPANKTITQTKGNGTKTGDTAPVDYDDMVYDLATQLNPVGIRESATYLSPRMRELQRTLDTARSLPRPDANPWDEVHIRDGGLVQRSKSAAQLLRELQRTQHAY